jgi:RNA-binding protein
MAELMLSPSERQHLKARAHELRPVVLLGAAGLTEMALREIDRALADHELVKIKVPGDSRGERAQVAAQAAEKLSAAKVQSIGKTIVLFRPRPESEEKREGDGRLDARRDGAKNRRRIQVKSRR